MKHTKEPWEAKADPSYYGIVSEICAMEKFIASLGGVCSPDEVEANARRIVACVNACAGITNEALEAGVVACGVNNLRDNIPEGNDKFYFYNAKVFEEDV